MLRDSPGAQLGADVSVKKIEVAVTRSLYLFSLGMQLPVKMSKGSEGLERILCSHTGFCKSASGLPDIFL